jgi:hypothetical protein
MQLALPIRIFRTAKLLFAQLAAIIPAIALPIVSKEMA